MAEKTLDPNAQASICRKLIEKVEVTPEGVKTHNHVGASHFENEMGESSIKHFGANGDTVTRK